MSSQINQLSPAQLQDLTTRFSASFLELWADANLWRHCCSYEATAVGAIPRMQIDLSSYYPPPFEIECSKVYTPEGDGDEAIALEAHKVAVGIFSALTRQVLLVLKQSAEVSGGIQALRYKREEMLRWLAANPSADTLVLSSALVQGLFGEVFHDDEYAPVEKHKLYAIGLMGEIHLWDDEDSKKWKIEPDRKITVYSDVAKYDDFKVWERGDHRALLYRRQDVKLWELPSTMLPGSVPGDLKCEFSHIPARGDEVLVCRSFSFVASGVVSSAKFTL